MAIKKHKLSKDHYTNLLLCMFQEVGRYMCTYTYTLK